MLELGHRVDSLESALERFITHVEQNRQKTDDIIAQMRQQASSLDGTQWNPGFINPRCLIQATRLMTEFEQV